MAELNFYWRMGNYALEAVPKCLARFSENEPNETVELVKYYQGNGRELKYTIGYFYYNTHEPCWELQFVGSRFKEILDGDVVAIFKMLKAAYDTLEEWSEGGEDESNRC